MNPIDLLLNLLLGLSMGTVGGLFGIGGGLVGLCPGPAIAALVTLQWPFLAFAAAMLAGMALHRVLHAPA